MSDMTSTHSRPPWSIDSHGWMRTVSVYALLLATSLSLSVAAADDQADVDVDADAPVSNVSQQADDPFGDDEDDSFEDLRRRLMDDLGVPPVVEPTRTERVHAVPSRIGQPAASVDVTLTQFTEASRRARSAFNEGAFISAKSGNIIQIAPGKYAFVFFEADEKDEPMMLLIQPNHALQELERQLEQVGWQTPVVASGQVHHYRQTSHLLLSFASYLDEEGPQVTFVDGVPVLASDEQEAQTEEQPQASEESAAATQEDDAFDAFDVDRFEAGGTSPLVRPSAVEHQAQVDSQFARADMRSQLERLHLTHKDLSTAPDVEHGPAHREGVFLVMRKGRLIRSPHTGWPMFLLDADSTQEGHEAPLALLPSRVLSQMEDGVAQQDQDQVFIVSGQVHQYQGHNYLMPTLMQRAVRRDNFH